MKKPHRVEYCAPFKAWNSTIRRIALRESLTQRQSETRLNPAGTAS